MEPTKPNNNKKMQTFFAKEQHLWSSMKHCDSTTSPHQFDFITNFNRFATSTKKSISLFYWYIYRSAFHLWDLINLMRFICECVGNSFKFWLKLCLRPFQSHIFHCHFFVSQWYLWIAWRSVISLLFFIRNENEMLDLRKALKVRS